MRQPRIGGGLAILGGSAIGAALMYLFDPDKGAARREKILSQTSGAAHYAANRFSHGVESLADHAHELSHRLSHQASQLASNAGQWTDAARQSASHATSEMADQARRIGSNLADQARHYASQVGEYVQGAAPDWRGAAKRVRGYAHDTVGGWTGESDSHAGAVAGYSISAAGLLTLGLGAMWLFDAEKGTERRQVVLDKMAHYLGQIGESFHVTGEFLTRQLSSAYGEAQRLFGDKSDDSAASNPGGSYGAPEGESGQENRERPIIPTDQSHLMRLGVGLAGGALGFYGATRRDWVGFGLGLGGLSMVACGLTALDYGALNEKAYRYGSALADKASDWSHQAQDTARAARDKAAEWGHKAGEIAHSGIEMANKGVEAARNRLNPAGGPESMPGETSSPTAQANPA